MRPGGNAVKIAFCLNGENRTEEVAGGEMLIDLLRDRLHVRSVKRGCENAECGACTVLVNGLAVNACIYLAARIDGKTVTTLEGVGGPESLHPIQQAVIEHGAVQCGFCGSGMILSALSLLRQNPAPTEHEIREGIAGNLCRCSGYTKIVEAVADAAERMRGGDGE